MDLTPFYDLRARLHAGAVAGAALAAEDFRLARALEGLAPLEGAAPVFRRLEQLTRALIAPDCPDRAGALLDALSLADAVACTQGAVAVPGAVEPLPLTARGRAVSNAPYSVLAPLREALTTPGGGKYSFVVETHEERPALFRDYRVTEALVRALGAAYPELADKAEEWLSREDGTILPLLESGFDPRGKKDMVRRVRVISAVAGAKANGFYLAQLEEAEKEVRAALIYALRLSESNAERLTGLCKTEKGSCKKMAHWALAKLESPAAWAYWDKLSARKPGQAAEYMALSTTAKAGALVAEALDRWLTPYEADPGAPLGSQEMEVLQTLLAALPGKSGPAICGIYRRMAALGTALDDKCWQGASGQSMAARFNRVTPLSTSRDSLPFSGAAAQALRQSILYHPAPDLLELAEELERTAGAAFAAPAITAALIARPAGEAYALAEPYLKPGPLGRQRKKECRAVLNDALERLCWEEDLGGLAFLVTPTDPAEGHTEYLHRPLLEPPDRRWYDAMTAAGGPLDPLLGRLLCPDDAEVCRRLGGYFYRRALLVSNSHEYLNWMKLCGWTKCEGLAVHYCKAAEPQNRWRIDSFLRAMPGGPEEKRVEAGQVLALLKSGQVKPQYRDDLDMIQYFLNHLPVSEPV